jgi:hypothetical protein
MPGWWYPLAVLWVVGWILYPVAGWIRAARLVRDLRAAARTQPKPRRRKKVARG